MGIGAFTGIVYHIVIKKSIVKYMVFKLYKLRFPSRKALPSENIISAYPSFFT